MAECVKTLRSNNLRVLMTALHVFQTIIAPIGMLTLTRFAYRLFRRSKDVDQSEGNENSLVFFIRIKSFLEHSPGCHTNMVILYVNHLVAAVLLSFFAIFTHIIFWGSFIISPECDIKFSPVFCIILNTPVHIFTHAVALSLLFLCLDRLLATLFYRSYASFRSRVCIIMVVVQYIICSLIFLYQIHTMNLQNRLSICSLVGSSNQHLTTHITIFTLELVSLAIFGILAKYNKRKLRSTLGLSLIERYQLDENVRSLCTIFPTICVNTACFFVPNAAALILFVILQPRKSEVVLLLNWLPYYGLLLPLVVHLAGKKTRRAQEQMILMNVVTGSAMQKNYFNDLNHAWK